MIAARLALFFTMTAILAEGGSSVSGVALSVSPNPSVFGKLVTLAATVPPTATGKVTFYAGTSILGVGTVSGGVVVLTTALLPAGSQPIRAYYSGDAFYQPAISPSIGHTVNATPANGFAMPEHYAITGSESQAVVVADFNGDGKPDLAISSDSNTNPVKGTISVLLANGDGTFQAPVTNSVVTAAYNIVAGDFNGDGRADLAITGNGVSILLGNGDGTFQPAMQVAGLNGGYLAVGDFNGDGKADLVFTQPYISVGVLLGNGDGTFQTPVSYAADPVGNVVVGDFNNDGKADVVVPVNGQPIQAGTSPDGLASVLLGNGDGTFQSPVNYDLGGPPGSSILAVADVNGDGQPDLIATTEFSISVLLGKGDGAFLAPAKAGSSGSSQFVTPGDFNGDGKTDIASIGGSDGTVSLFLGNGDGSFQPPMNYGAGYFPGTLAPGAFGGDGRSDLAVLIEMDSDSNNLSILLGNAALTPQVVLRSSSNPSTYGQPVTLTANVSPVPQGGTITFSDGPVVLGTVPADAGFASLTLPALGGGSHSLVAFYYSASQNAVSPVVTQTVSRAATATALTSSANPSIYLQPLILTATVTPPTATGTVTFSSELGLLASDSPLVNGTATFAVSPNLQNSALIHSPITGYYSGDSNYTASTSPALTQTINASPTTITLTSSPNPSNFYQNVTLTATISPTVSGGTITFSDGSTTLGTSGANGGVGNLVISTLSAGIHSLSASYDGYFSLFTGSTSPIVTQVVDPQSPGAPVVQFNGVVNAANPAGIIGPGTWVAIYGANLSDTTRIWTESDFIGNSLPTSLDGTSVTVNGKPAYVYYVSPTQLNVLTPLDTTQGSVPVQVVRSGSFSNSVTMTNLTIGPAFFRYSQNPRYAIAEDGLTFAMLGPPGIMGPAVTTRPASVGEVITLYATGLGETSPSYQDGQIIQTPLPLAPPTPQVLIGGVAATVEYAGLVEAGVYQINVEVPSVPAGDASIDLSERGSPVPGQAFISVQ